MCDNSEKKDWRKKFSSRYWKQREPEAIINNILERMKVSWVCTDSQSSEENEENLELSRSIFEIFDEVRIQRNGNWLFRSFYLGAFGSEDSHDIDWKMFTTIPNS